MYTSLLLLALTGFTSSADRVESPTWLTDYNEGRKQGLADMKPVAVFVAPGKEAWNKLARSGVLGKEANERLAANYVCVFLDSQTEEGKKLARLLDLSGGLGLVISDHTGELMAFHHEGDLADQKLIEYLQRYSNSERVVRTTETNPGDETIRSYYPPVYYPPAYAPAQPSYRSSGGGRSC